MNWDSKKHYIEQLDFSKMINKLINQSIPNPYNSYQWERVALEQAVNRYKKYLFILVKYKNDYDMLPPTLEIDEIWHHHILDTQKYMDDCQFLYGQYLHHYPYFGLEEQGTNYKVIYEALQRTRKLFFLEFNEELIEPKQDEIVALMKALLQRREACV